MSGPSASRRSARLLVALQVMVIVATLFAPLPATASDDPPADPSPTPSAEPTPTPTPEATPEPTPEATPEPTPEPTPTPTPDPALATEPWIVTFVAGVSADDKDAILAAVHAVQTGSIPQLRMRTILLDPATDAASVAALREDPRVARVDADRLRVAEEAPSDPSYDAQWALPQIGWDVARETYAAPGDAVVAVLDTGVDASHPDLDDAIVTGASILDGSTWSVDPNGHGTAMAGIVAAETDNGQGIAGVGYAGVKVMPVTVLAPDGTGQDSDVIAGVVWAADHGADVILMAFSSGSYSASLQAAVDYAWSGGAVLVAAAGNDGSSVSAFPAGDRGVIGVSNTTQTDELAAGSNYGDSVFLGAPGVSIYTTDNGGGYRYVSGTSASAAVVAGAAAQLIAVDPSASNGVVVGRLARNADPAGTVAETGNGRVNLARALGDTSSDSIQPAGTTPVGNGGPFVGPYAIASRTINSATLNGTASVTVASGASITAALSVTTDNAGGNNDWQSTGWRISTSPGTLTCVDHGNHTSSGTFSESFAIVAPALAGTYNVYFIAYASDTCGGGGPSATFILNNGVIVDATAPTVTINQAAGQVDPLHGHLQ
jgi:subtilisin family serine protease